MNSSSVLVELEKFRQITEVSFLATLISRYLKKN